MRNGNGGRFQQILRHRDLLGVVRSLAHRKARIGLPGNQLLVVERWGGLKGHRERVSLVSFAVDHDPVRLVKGIGGRGRLRFGHAGRRSSIDDLRFHRLGLFGDGGRNDQLTDLGLWWGSSRRRWGKVLDGGRPVEGLLVGLTGEAVATAGCLRFGFSGIAELTNVS